MSLPQWLPDVFFLSVTHSEKCILLCISVCILHKHMYNTHLTEHHLVLTTWDALTYAIHFKLFYSNLKISSLWPAKMVSHGLTNLQFEKHWRGWGGIAKSTREPWPLFFLIYHLMGNFIETRECAYTKIKIKAGVFEWIYSLGPI